MKLLSKFEMVSIVYLTNIQMLKQFFCMYNVLDVFVPSDKTIRLSILLGGTRDNGKCK